MKKPENENNQFIEEYNSDKDEDELAMLTENEECNIIEETDVNMTGSGSSAISSIGILILGFASQRAALLMNDQILAFGLNGRIDVLVILFAISMSLKTLYENFQLYIYNVNKKQKCHILHGKYVTIFNDKMNTKKPTRRFVVHHGANNTIENGNNVNDIYLKRTIGDRFIVIKSAIIWRRFFKDILDFFVLSSSFLTTIYAENSIRIFLELWNVSFGTAILFIIPIFLFIINIKSEYLSDRQDLKYQT